MMCAPHDFGIIGHSATAVFVIIGINLQSRMSFFSGLNGLVRFFLYLIELLSFMGVLVSLL